MATAAGEADRSVTSQELATSRIKLPVLPSTVAAHSTAKTGRLSGENAEPLGLLGIASISLGSARA
jgi:hypothetical protein